MFGHGRRATSNPPVNYGTKADRSAATAAAQAFLARQTSSASLSAAAAATALRSRPTTPTSVADVQTKRTIRRTNSNSSVGSSVSGSTRGHSGGPPERRGSTSSMRERSFRESSPNRPRDSQDAPPVPAIPKNKFSLVPQKSPKRATSVDLIRTRNVSSGPGNAEVTQSHRTTGFRQRTSSVSSMNELTDLERSESRGSVNFSYPTSSGLSPYRQRQLTSSTTQSGSQKQIPMMKKSLMYDPNTRSLLPEAEVLFYKHDIQDIAGRPVKKKKPARNAAGTHLKDGTVGGRIRGTAVDSTRLAQQTGTVQNSPTSTNPMTPTKKESTSENLRNDLDKTSTYNSGSPVNVKYIDTGGGISLGRKPSIVREERELEEAEDDSNGILSHKTSSRSKSDASEDRSVLPLPSSRPSPKTSNECDVVIAPEIHTTAPQHSQQISLPAQGHSCDFDDIAPTQPLSTGQNNSVASKTPRVQSVSPTRNAHFLATPESLPIKHQPPPRSVSPRKSAMKHSASPRDGSPIGDLSVGPCTSHVQLSSEVSDASTTISDERNVPRKKPVRVSFDDDSNVVLGQDNSSLPEDSPLKSMSQSNGTWFSGPGRGRAREYGSIDNLNDETMQPRPALPSFDSIRERRSHDTEERPLIKLTKPTDLRFSQSVCSTSSDGHSSDHRLGLLVSQAQESKIASNVSRSPNPLPPEVTSVEGSGYISDTDSSIYSLDLVGSRTYSDNVNPTGVNDAYPKQQQATNSPISSGHEIHLKSNGNGNIPSLTVTQATPTLEYSESKRERPSIPGEFPSSDSSQNDTLTDAIDHQSVTLMPASHEIFEPSPAIAPVPSKTATEHVNHYLLAAEETDSDGESIYSDAAEDLSGLGSDGFMSLDAVVENPIPQSIPGLVMTTQDTQTLENESWGNARPSRESDDPNADRILDQAQDARKGIDGGTFEAELGLNLEQNENLARQAENDSQGSQPERRRNQGRTNVSIRGAKETDIRAPILKPSMRPAPTSTTRDSIAPAAQSKFNLKKNFRALSSSSQAVSPDSTKGKLRSRNLSTEADSSTLEQGISTPDLTLRRSASGDSESSFKRIRSSGRGFTIKKSMRDAKERAGSPKAEASLRSSRFSLRSLSPSGSRLSNMAVSQPVSLSQKTMRKNQILQNQSDTPTLRSTTSGRTKSALHVPGFGRSKSGSEERVRPTRVSRIIDSSDDEDVRPSFRSRFADSSDEEDVPSLPLAAPTKSNIFKGSPQRAATIDNKLHTSEEKPSATANPVSSALANVKSAKGDSSPSSNFLHRSGSGRGYMGSVVTTSMTEGSSLKPENKRRGSIMSILRRKRPDITSKIRKSELESAARRDTPLERSQSDLRVVKRQGTNLFARAGATSPKLRKRREQKREGNEIVQMQQTDRTIENDIGQVAGNGPEASITLEGAVNNMGALPTANGLEATDLHAEVPNIDPVSVLPAKKRKRFQKMRRVFGLDY